MKKFMQTVLTVLSIALLLVIPFGSSVKAQTCYMCAYWWDGVEIRAFCELYYDMLVGYTNCFQFASWHCGLNGYECDDYV